MRSIRFTAVLALGAAALIAPAAAGAATPIKVSEKEFSITGVPKTLKHGVKYTVTLTNKGKFPHDMLFDGKGVHDVGIHNAHAIAPGQERVVHGDVPEGRHLRVLLRHQGPRARRACRARSRSPERRGRGDPVSSSSRPRRRSRRGSRPARRGR